ncbi:hypothetical protein I317_02971 [Kwoniella heveanensis CBS 569]|uniref:Uncharacterized protein n=1 Tax=Kwoniella heveanensis BCC8398 TaxID=1296120 RepID=A0A1B9H0F8_9TREE|nr:hypothetical protein I316_01323 [Kwoniella heveanensis BCC8398]OCF43127.1 hypothetical protein I317_02971 [Kwoniella heveanensis CBS 569]
MDDLIASLGGSMHVSQEGYDLKALQEYLAQTMVRPSLPLSPNPAFRPIPPSRSASSTRKPSSLPSSYTFPDGGMNMNQAYPYPSPISTAFSSYADEPQLLNAATPTGIQRPGTLRRSSSYGFGCAINVNVAAPSSPSASYSAFESDAFAPLWQQQQMESQDPWAKIRAAQQGDAFHQYGYNSASHGQDNAFAGSSQSSGFGAFRPAQGFGLAQQTYPMGIGGSPPTPPAEDDEEMDEEYIDCEMDEEEEEEDRVERVMGLSALDGSEDQYADGDEMFGRGRRKF